MIWALVLQCPMLSGQVSAPTQIDFRDCPAGMEVFLDGNWIGTTSVSTRFLVRGLLPGTYNFTFKREGQLVHSCSVQVVAGQSVSIPVAPEPAPPKNTISTQTRPDASHPKRIPAPAPSPDAAGAPTLTQRTVAAPLPRAPRPAAKAPVPAIPPQASRPATAVLSSVDERVVLFPLLAVTLVLGSILAIRFFSKPPVPQGEAAPEVPVQPVTEEPGETEVSSSHISGSEPEFIESLRFRESLFQKGFSKPKRISESDIVVDIDSYEVGKEL